MSVSLKKLCAAFGIVLSMVLAMPKVAAAGPIYTFSVSSGTQPSNVGTITLTQTNANTVDVKVDLSDTTLPAPQYGFINTGGSHIPFGFTIAGSETGVTATFLQPTGGSFCPANNSCPPTGFQLLSLDLTGGGSAYGISIDSSAQNGSAGAYYGDLEFLLTRPTGLSTDDFIVGNGAGYFAADLTNGQNTGTQVWNQRTLQQTPVPEPASMLLLGTGLVAAARARRRKNG